LTRTHTQDTPPCQTPDSEASAAYLESYRRYNYTTPKSYLELISLYKDLLARKRRVSAPQLGVDGGTMTNPPGFARPAGSADGSNP
jgi:hypothetical protein